MTAKPIWRGLAVIEFPFLCIPHQIKPAVKDASAETSARSINVVLTLPFLARRCWADGGNVVYLNASEKSTFASGSRMSRDGATPPVTVSSYLKRKAILCTSTSSILNSSETLLRLSIVVLRARSAESDVNFSRTKARLIFVYDVDCKQESFEKYNDVLSRIVDKTLMSDIAAKVDNSDEVMRDVLKKVADFELELVSSASDVISRLIDMIVNADADNTDYPRCLRVMQKFDTWLCSMNAIVSQENFKIKYLTQRIKEKEDARHGNASIDE